MWIYLSCELLTWIVKGLSELKPFLVCVACSSSVSALMRGVEGGYILACTSVLSHWSLFLADVLVSVYGVVYVTCSDFVKFCAH